VTKANAKQHFIEPPPDELRCTTYSNAGARCRNKWSTLLVIGEHELKVCGGCARRYGAKVDRFNNNAMLPGGEVRNVD
jgi:hypothetical protein